MCVYACCVVTHTPLRCQVWIGAKWRSCVLHSTEPASITDTDGEHVLPEDQQYDIPAQPSASTGHRVQLLDDQQNSQRKWLHPQPVLLSHQWSKVAPLRANTTHVQYSLLDQSRTEKMWQQHLWSVKVSICPHPCSPMTTPMTTPTLSCAFTQHCGPSCSPT